MDYVIEISTVLLIISIILVVIISLYMFEIFLITKFYKNVGKKALHQFIYHNKKYKLSKFELSCIIDYLGLDFKTVYIEAIENHYDKDFLFYEED